MRNELKTLSNIHNILAKAELAKRLLNDLPEEDIAKVVKFLLDEGVEFNGERVEYNFAEIEVRIYDDPIEFGKVATLHQSEFSHSWAGGDETESLRWVVVGDVEFGESIFYQYSQNGDSRSPKESYHAPEFSLDTNQIILIRIQKDDTYNDRDYHSVDWCLHVYQPGDYKLPDWVKELAERFGW